METIEINKKEYWLAKDVKENYILKCDAEKKYALHAKTTIKDLGEAHLDDCNVLALGKVSLEGEWVSSRLSLQYLERIIKVFKTIHFVKNTTPSVDIVWADNLPVMFGTLDKEKKECAGIIVAPRVTND